jgi:hypothetical protein
MVEGSGDAVVAGSGGSVPGRSGEAAVAGSGGAVVGGVSSADAAPTPPAPNAAPSASRPPAPAATRARGVHLVDELMSPTSVRVVADAIERTCDAPHHLRSPFTFTHDTVGAHRSHVAFP